MFYKKISILSFKRLAGRRLGLPSAGCHADSGCHKKLYSAPLTLYPLLPLSQIPADVHHRHDRYIFIVYTKENREWKLSH